MRTRLRIVGVVLLLLLLARIAGAQPTLSTITPTINAGSNTQTLTVAGTNFAKNASFRLTNPSGAAVSNKFHFVSTTQATIGAVYSINGSWTVQMKVRNNLSNALAFTVGSTPVPPLTISCPANITVTTTGLPVVVTFPSPTTTGGVAPVIVTTAPLSGSGFAVGTTTVSGSATDNVGTIRTCTFTVTVTTTPVPTCSGATIGALTPGALSLASTLQSISLTAPFTGSASGATVASAYRPTGTSTWLDGYAPYLDLRATIGAPPVTNPYANQARGPIIGLTQNTSYDVKVTWTNGSGTSCVQGTVSTLTSTPTVGGGTPRSITNNTTQASALAAANPGDTLTWSLGAYNAFSFTRSGTSGAWIVLDGANVASINGTGVTNNISIAADYVIVKNFTLSVSDFNGLTASGNHIIVDHITVQGFSTLCANGPTTTHLNDSGISVGGTYIFVTNSSITGSPNLSSSCIQSPPYAGPGLGIAISSCTSCVIDSNTLVNNAARDGISADNSLESLGNVDISNNTVSDYLDDGIESKGDNLNVRMWGNATTSARATTCMATNTNPTGGDTLAPNMYGPAYFFRNTCTITGTLLGGELYKMTPNGPAFVFHNSFKLTTNAGFSLIAATTGPFVFLNNAIESINTYPVLTGGAATDAYDYDVIKASASNWTDGYNGVAGALTFTQFRSAGQEAHGQNADPLFADSALHLSPVSPCIDAGVVINNFNTADSPWPPLGPKPDVGRYEKQ